MWWFVYGEFGGDLSYQNLLKLDEDDIHHNLLMAITKCQWCGAEADNVNAFDELLSFVNKNRMAFDSTIHNVVCMGDC